MQPSRRFFPLEKYKYIIPMSATILREMKEKKESSSLSNAPLWRKNISTFSGRVAARVFFRPLVTSGMTRARSASFSTGRKIIPTRKRPLITAIFKYNETLAPNLSRRFRPAKLLAQEPDVTVPFGIKSSLRAAPRLYPF